MKKSRWIDKYITDGLPAWSAVRLIVGTTYRRWLADWLSDWRSVNVQDERKEKGDDKNEEIGQKSRDKRWEKEIMIEKCNKNFVQHAAAQTYHTREEILERYKIMLPL